MEIQRKNMSLERKKKKKKLFYNMGNLIDEKIWESYMR